MVGTDEDEVDRVLRAGGLACPGCSGVLAPWGYARRRTVRAVGEVWRLRPRRSRCGACGVSHVLLPTSCLVRRADSVAVIGAALVDKAAGLGHRGIAEAIGRAGSTVRGWLRSFSLVAGVVGAAVTRLLLEIDPLCGSGPVGGSVLADVVQMIGAAGAAVRRRLGASVGRWSPWQVVGALSGGWLLHPARCRESINTSWLWAARV
jgi:hypothetical protein